VEGVYQYIYEGEGYSAVININGKDEYIPFPERLMYFFIDTKNYGQRIKFVLKKFRAFSSEYRCCGEGFGCTEEVEISDVMIANR
jgi:hypothetical protein